MKVKLVYKAYNLVKVWGDLGFLPSVQKILYTYFHFILKSFFEASWSEFNFSISKIEHLKSLPLVRLVIVKIGKINII